QEHAQDHPEDQRHPPGDPGEETQTDQDARGDHDDADHDRYERLVLLALHLERLPDLLTALLRRCAGGLLGRLAVFLRRFALRHASQDTGPRGAWPPRVTVVRSLRSPPHALEDGTRLLPGASGLREVGQV